MSPEEREVIRLAPPVVLWWVWIAFVAANAVDYAVQGLPSARFGAVVAAILLLVTALMYTLALRPRVVIDAGGLTVVNPFRTRRVPWRLITSVDTGDWVRVCYASGPGVPGGTSGDTRKVDCWALFVSARAKRKIARGPGYARPSSRLPDEARYLASLPVPRAMAVRLDKRAQRERAREPGTGSPGTGSPGTGAASASASGTDPGAAALTALTAAENWSWPSIAAIAVPALILLVVILA